MSSGLSTTLAYFQRSGALGHKTVARKDRKQGKSKQFGHEHEETCTVAGLSVDEHQRICDLPFAGFDIYTQSKLHRYDGC